MRYSSSAQAANESNCDLFDTHLHLLRVPQWSYGWLDGVPALKRPWLLGEYRAEATAAGICGALFMEAFVDQAHDHDEARWAQALCDKRAGGVHGFDKGVRFEKAGTARVILRDKPIAVRGLRRVLHVAPDDFSASSSFRENMRTLEGPGVPFELCVRSSQLEVALQLVERFPGVVFVLDHAGNPSLEVAGSDVWANALSRIAKHRNVWCKISGLVSNLSPAKVSLRRLAPSLETVVTQFGAARVVWGSDWPACTLSSSLAHWVEITREFFSSAPQHDQARIFHGNATQLYRLNQ